MLARPPADPPGSVSAHQCTGDTVVDVPDEVDAPDDVDVDVEITHDTGSDGEG